VEDFGLTRFGTHCPLFGFNTLSLNKSPANAKPNGAQIG
jgi:hypothetical protein